MTNCWEKAKSVSIRTSQEIVGGFSMGFDPKIPEETKDTLIRFVYWVEDHYNLPVTLWVDFLHRRYLVDKNAARVDYKFYWVDFDHYPVFEKEADIPVIELPVRRNMEANISSLIEALTCYFAWLCNEYMVGFEPDKGLTEMILKKYLSEAHDNA